LPVEHEPKRHPFLHPDEVRGVAAPDGDLHLLDAAPDLRPAGLFGSEEKYASAPVRATPPAVTRISVPVIPTSLALSSGRRAKDGDLARLVPNALLPHVPLIAIPP
jgi:hypothetical protein